MKKTALFTALMLLPAAVIAQETFSGIGINISKVKDQGVLVESVVPGGPADRSGGLQKGDVITAIAEGEGIPVPLAEKSLEEAVELIRGKDGSSVRVIVEKRVSITRGKIEPRKVTRQATRPPLLEVGAEAPDIEFEVLADGSKEMLSKYKGKVIVLDFWATWCGPCQKPMAKMQTYAKDHPEFGDQVLFMALSIDRDKGRVVPHLDRNGWDKTHNCWGDNAGVSRPYGVSGIPTVYVIGQDGKVAERGHPATMDIPAIVKGLLDKGGTE